MKTWRTAPVKCPNCGYSMDAHTEAGSGESRGESRGPKLGDLGVCIECATVMEFVENGEVKQATNLTVREAPPELRRVVRAIKKRNANESAKLAQLPVGTAQ